MEISRRSFLATGLVASAGAGLAISPHGFGASGNGIDDDTAALVAAFDAARRRGTSVSLQGGKTYLAGDMTIPEGVLVVFEPGARLKPVSGKSKLVLDGRIVSVAIDRIFEDGWSFAKTNIENGYEDIPLEWFGGKASRARDIDSSKAFEYAMSFCKALRSRNILLDHGYYYVSKTIVIDWPIGIKGQGMQSTVLFGPGRTPNAAVIQLSGSQGANIGDIGFSDFTIMSLNPRSGVGMRSIWFAHIALNNMQFRAFAVGLELKSVSYSWRIFGCKFLENDIHVVFGDNSNNIIVSQSQFLHGKTGIYFTGSSNSISICDESNFEAITGRPVSWNGNGTRIVRLSIIDSRFEKCIGAIGRGDGDARVIGLNFERNYLENNAGTSTAFFDIPDCESVTIARSYFERATKGLLRAPVSAVQVTICDNVLVNIPQINAASRSGGLAAAEGFIRCRVYACGGVRGSSDA